MYLWRMLYIPHVYPIYLTQSLHLKYVSVLFCYFCKLLYCVLRSLLHVKPGFRPPPLHHTSLHTVHQR